MLGRRKTTDAAQAPQEIPPADGQGKNRPTPRRRDVEAARKQPLVPTGRGAGGRGASGKAARQAARAERVKAREQMMAGNERFLPLRDRGPVRRFARDVVDGRWNVGELLLPVMLGVLLLSFVGGSVQRQNPAVYTGVLAVTYTMVLAAAFDAFLMARNLKKALIARFGDGADLKGIRRYAVMRAFQLRRTRIPRPAVERGQPPA